MITAFAGSTAPTNWQLCYGQTLSRTTYAALFAVISTTYNTGGEAGTDFRLPDLRGRTVAGLDNMGGTDANRLSTANVLGTTTGTETVTLATTDIPSHGHTPTVTNNAVTSGAGSNHSHGNSLTGTTTFAANGHAHTQQSSFTSAYSVGNGFKYTEGETVVQNTVGTFGNNTAASVGISNAGEASHNHSVTSNVTVSNANTGGGGAHNNMQPTMTINYIILAGV
jgi:microcystin-dependent protein